jgi:hypothetical protein
MKGCIDMKKLDESLEQMESNTGDHTESLKELDENAIEDPALVNTVDGRLANLRKLESGIDDSAEVDDEIESPIPDVPEDETEEDDGQAADEDDSGTSTPKAEDGKDSQEKNTVEIPEAYVRAAIHQGWKQDDVDALIEANPELALTSLASCYNSVTNASREWSALGRAKIQSERDSVESKTTSQEEPDIAPLVDKLKESYGNDPLIEVVTKLLQRDTKNESGGSTTNAQQPADLYKTATQRANATADASIDARVAAFFESSELKPYEEYYGSIGLSQSINDLTNGQQEHRFNVMEEAECILTGLRMRGVDATVEQVLEKAHLLVTEPIREQVIRNSLKDTTVKRKKTLRPSKSKKTSTAVSASVNSGKPKNRQELLNRVDQRLASVPGLRN